MSRNGSKRGRLSAFLWALILIAAVAAVGLARPAPARAAAQPGQVCFVFCPPASSTTTAPSPTTLPPPTTLPAPTTTVPGATTTVPAPTTTTTTVPAPSGGGKGGGAALTPCSPEPSGACSQDPTQVQVDYPKGAQPAGTEVTFVTTGRSPSAPEPVTGTVVLAAADAHPCPGAPAGEAALCWNWPSGLRDGAFILNGTYRVTPCSDTTGGHCRAATTFSPASVGVAVPPQSPGQAAADVSGSQVTVHWSPAADPEPDLVGYAVSRDGQVVYACSTDGLGPGAGTPCPADLTIADHPGDGRWSYAVTALRLGADTAAADVLTSAPTAIQGASVSVAGAAPGASSGSGPLVPLAGFAPETSGAGTVATGGFATNPPAVASGSSAGGLAGAAGDPAPSTAPVQNLAYPGDGGVVGKSQDLALKVGEPGPHTDIVPVAVLALGIIALAVAAHFLYLRVELGLLEARRAAGVAVRPARRRLR